VGRVLEEFGKWFLHVALALAISFVIKPLSEGKIFGTEGMAALAGTIVFLVIGGILLYLSTKLRS